MGPEDFWQSTFDEVLLVIQGLIDRQRVERNNAYGIFCSNVVGGSPPSIFMFNPLPYDEELQKDEDNLSDEEIYEQGKLIRLPNTSYAQ